MSSPPPPCLPISGPGCRAHSEHRFPAPSSRLCQIWLRHRRGTLCLTLRASLSGTFLQTLPDLVTPQKGHSLSHTPSIAFRHLPPDSARFGYATEGALFVSHSEHRFPAPSSKLCQIWLRHRRGTLCLTLRASLSGTFLQTLPDLVTPQKGHSLSHTPSIAFRHLPPNSARFGYATEGALFVSHSEHRFPAPSSKLCQIWLRHRRGTLCLTLRASLSGTFLQTLPDLVTPQKGHSLSHTPSIAFRHLPPNSARFGYATEGALFVSHSEHRFPAPSSKLCQIWLRHRRGTLCLTLRASLSGTFLQTLPDLVTPQKGHSLSHTPSIAFRHLPPNSARFGYATEGAPLYLRAALQRRGQRPPKGSGTNMTFMTLAPPIPNKPYGFCGR